MKATSLPGGGGGLQRCRRRPAGRDRRRRRRAAGWDRRRNIRQAAGGVDDAAVGGLPEVSSVDYAMAGCRTGSMAHTMSCHGDGLAIDDGAWLPKQAKPSKAMYLKGKLVNFLDF